MGMGVALTLIGLVAVAIGLVVSLTAFFFAAPLLRLMQLPPELMH